MRFIMKITKVNKFLKQIPFRLEKVSWPYWTTEEKQVGNQFRHQEVLQSRIVAFLDAALVGFSLERKELPLFGEFPSVLKLNRVSTQCLCKLKCKANRNKEKEKNKIFLNNFKWNE
jgi:hypothetical protein